MKTNAVILLLIFLLLHPLSLFSLPVKLGTIETGLESFDGYQEGLAYLSTDENGKTLEILVSYKGFGLDTVAWFFSDESFSALRDSFSRASWWRSRLLDIDVEQNVEKEITLVNISENYVFRGSNFNFDSIQCALLFVRQGHDYAVLLKEKSEGAETRRLGDKAFPVFTLHFRKDNITRMRDMLSEDNIQAETSYYREQKTIIKKILDSSPEEKATGVN